MSAAGPLARPDADAAFVSLGGVGGEESEYGSEGEEAMTGRAGWPSPASLFEEHVMVSMAFPPLPAYEFL